MPYYPDIEFCIKLANVIGYHPLKGFTKVQVFLYSISWMLLPVAPFLTITKLCKGNEITVEALVGVSCNITVYLHGLFRNSVLFFGRKQMKSLIETTKQFWPLENYDVIVRKTRKETLTYTWMIFSFTLSDCVKRHFNLPATGLYFPQWAPKHIWVLVQDIATEWELLGFIASDILFRTLIIQLTMQLKLLNQKLLKLYDSDEHDEQMIQNKLRECIEHYVILIRCAEGINKFFSSFLMVAFSCDTFSCTVNLYIIMRAQDPRIIAEGMLHILAAFYMISFCYCIPAQAMTNEISSVSTSAYLSNWQNYSKNTKDIILVILAAQKQFEVTAGGIVPLNMQTLLGVRSFTFLI
ncbi:unnamed protein product [Callosobruchus maculatus]|uniref:Odorant receptor n=1 Tax=Callosobruchus maculatus TaxID=64391 RepID=A0A653D4R0_CALMS|nr:unnamed protein product [Callosobruchus maculatus]